MLKSAIRRLQPCKACYRKLSSSTKSLTCAIVGSGPAGFYTAARLLAQDESCRIDLYEALPVPYGLARFGVAPDHPEVKNVTHKFDEVASSSRVRFLGNVVVGRDVSLRDLAHVYDSIVFCYGASNDRALNIPGEDMPGVVTAKSFVGWYNGLPEAANFDIRLDSVESVVVIGQGNVALDIARILLSSIEDLRKTDISEQALQTLSAKRIRSVSIVGRRGPLQASFTIKEVRELINMRKASFVNSQKHLYDQALEQTLARPQRRLMALLSTGQPSATDQRTPHWDIEYLLSPLEFLGDESLRKIRFEKNKIQDTGGRVQAIGTGETVWRAAELALTSIGYKAESLPGMMDLGIIFDTTRGILPNDAGRISALDGLKPGLYCAGWAKNGPVGVIASTMRDAYETADKILVDWKAGVTLPRQGQVEELTHGLRERTQVVDWEGWKRIERYEARAGEKTGRPAAKVTDIQKMLQIACG